MRSKRSRWQRTGNVRTWAAIQTEGTPQARIRYSIWRTGEHLKRLERATRSATAAAEDLQTTLLLVRLDASA